MLAEELNFEGLAGPTHHYGGLAPDNLASIQHSRAVSNPKQAALEGLEKMHQIHALGGKQAIFPPQERPYLPFLRQVGYTGTDAAILARAAREDLPLLAAASSSSSMWTANAATICPSADAEDGRVHFTPANMVTTLHRSYESAGHGAFLKKVFSDPHFFLHHAPLPAHLDYADEGAANHTRLCKAYGLPGLQLFVFGRSARTKSTISPRHFPGRQTEEASRAIGKLHLLDPKRTLFAQQHPEAIDAGAFHNDVVAVGNLAFFFYHERAFLEEKQLRRDLTRRFKECTEASLQLLAVSETQIPLKEAVKTYLFNSQILTLPNQQTIWIAPQECRESEQVRQFLEDGSLPISQLLFQNLRQSMQNGGGPACLRLRIVLTAQEQAAMHQPVLFTDALYVQLTNWVKRYYRDRLSLQDLADPCLLQESRAALDELTDILQLGAFYSFQKSSLEQPC